MKTPLKNVPTLQEYMHQKKMKFVFDNDCLECTYFKRSLLMCVKGDKLRFIGKLVECPKK